MTVLYSIVAAIIILCALNVAIGAYRNLDRQERITGNAIIAAALVVAFLVAWLTTR